MASASERLATSNPDLAVALAAQALKRSDVNTAAVGAAYKRTRVGDSTRLPCQRHRSDSGPVRLSPSLAITFSPWRHENGVVADWDLQEGRSLWSAALERSDRGVSAIAVAPAGDLVRQRRTAGRSRCTAAMDACSDARCTHAGGDPRAGLQIDGSQARREAATSTSGCGNARVRPRVHGAGSMLAQRTSSSVRASPSAATRVYCSTARRTRRGDCLDLGSAQRVGRIETLPASIVGVEKPGGESKRMRILAGATDGTLNLIDLATVPSNRIDPAFGLPKRRGRQSPRRRGHTGSDQRGVRTGRQLCDLQFEEWTLTLWGVAPRTLEPLRPSAARRPGRSCGVPPVDSFVSGSGDGTVRSGDSTLASKWRDVSQLAERPPPRGPSGTAGRMSTEDAAHSWHCRAEPGAHRRMELAEPHRKPDHRSRAGTFTAWMGQASVRSPLRSRPCGGISRQAPGPEYAPIDPLPVSAAIGGQTAA